jgi:hypothetical protein
MVNLPHPIRDFPVPMDARLPSIVQMLKNVKQIAEAIDIAIHVTGNIL